MAEGAFHRRRLPHYQPDDKAIFVSFRSYFKLTPAARSLVLQSCLYEHKRRTQLYAAVIMPDHVHLCFSLLRDPETTASYRLEAVMKDIKGVSAHRIVKLMNLPFVWQEEYFDYVLRTYERLEGAMEYIRQNPVKAKLVSSPEQYKWLWETDDYIE
jgi:REP element-mobilizing transposase RayT